MFAAVNTLDKERYAILAISASMVSLYPEGLACCLPWISRQQAIRPVKVPSTTLPSA